MTVQKLEQEVSKFRPARMSRGEFASERVNVSKVLAVSVPKRNVIQLRGSLNSTKEEIDQLTTTKEMLITIRQKLYASGNPLLIPLARKISDGTPFDVWAQENIRGLGGRYAYQNALTCLSHSEKEVIATWQTSQPLLSIHEIDTRLLHLQEQLAVLTSCLPSPEETEEGRAKAEQVGIALEQYAEQHRTYYDGLKATLADLFPGLEANCKLRIHCLKLKGKLREVTEAYGVETPNLPRIPELNDDKDLEELLELFLRAVRHGQVEPIR